MSGLLQAAPTFLAAEAEGGKAHASTSIWGILFYVTLTLVVLFALMAYAKKGLQPRFFTNPITQLFEQLYLFVENMTVGVIGPRGRKYIPMVMVLWMVIFVGNFIALFFPTSQTANLSFNLGMALLAVGYVQWEGIRQNGFFGHMSHFAGPKLGIGLIAINIIVFLIELISELMKNVSLSLRLYGNIDGGHRAAVAMNDLGKHAIDIGPLELSIPFGSFLIPIKLLTVVVQALIFTLLFCVYVSLVTHEEYEGGHELPEEKDPNSHKEKPLNMKPAS